MVVLVITGLRATLEMPRVSRVRVIGKGSGSTPERHRKRQHKRRDQQRDALPHLLTPSPRADEVAGCATGLARPFLGAHPFLGGGFLSLYLYGYDAPTLAGADESAMNLRRSSEKNPSTHFTSVNRTSTGSLNLPSTSPTGRERVACGLLRSVWRRKGRPRARVEEGATAGSRGAARAVRRLRDRPGGRIGPGVVRGAGKTPVPGAAGDLLPGGGPLLRAIRRRRLPRPGAHR